MKAKTLFAVVLMLFASTLAAKKVYKYTDENGKTFYSDEPIEGAETIKLPPIQTYTSSPLSLDPALEPAPEKAPVQYQLVIVEPEHDFVVGKDINELYIKVFVEPKLYKNHFVQLMINDKLFGVAQKELLFTLDNLVRGTQTIKAVILDTKNNKKILFESQAIDVHVQRAKVALDNPFRQLNPPQDS